MPDRKGNRSVFEILRGLVSKQTELRGGVAPGDLGRERVETIVYKMFHGFDSQKPVAPELSDPSRADWYGGKGIRVSIEDARETQLSMQEDLDQQIVDENLGISHHDKHGLQPCRRVRKGDS